MREREREREREVGGGGGKIHTSMMTTSAGSTRRDSSDLLCVEKS